MTSERDRKQPDPSNSRPAQDQGLEQRGLFPPGMPAGLVRRKLSARYAGHAGGTPGKTTLTGGLLYRAPAPDADGVAADAPDRLDRANAQAGAPLPDPHRRRFEGSLGVDLSGVRVHTGEPSATAAAAVGARAYTIGQDIHFGLGQFNLGSAGGDELLAHEVAHTVQQRGSTRRQFKLEVSSPGDAAEQEADRAAASMVRGMPAEVLGSDASFLNRWAIQPGPAPQGTAPPGQGAAAGPAVGVPANPGLTVDSYTSQIQAIWTKAIDELNWSAVQAAAEQIVGLWTSFQSSSPAASALDQAREATGVTVGLQDFRGAAIAGSWIALDPGPPEAVPAFIRSQAANAAWVVKDTQQIYYLLKGGAGRALADSEQWTIVGLINAHPEPLAGRFIRAALDAEGVWLSLTAQLGDGPSRALASLTDRQQEVASVSSQAQVAAGASAATNGAVEVDADQIEAECHATFYLSTDKVVAIVEKYAPPQRAALLQILDRRGLIDVMLGRGDADRLTVLIDETPGFAGRKYDAKADQPMGFSHAVKMGSEDAARMAPGAFAHEAGGFYQQMGMPEVGRDFDELGDEANTDLGVDPEEARESSAIGHYAGRVVAVLPQLFGGGEGGGAEPAAAPGELPAGEAPAELGPGEQPGGELGPGQQPAGQLGPGQQPAGQLGPGTAPEGQPGTELAPQDEPQGGAPAKADDGAGALQKSDQAEGDEENDRGPGPNVGNEPDREPKDKAPKTDDKPNEEPKPREATPQELVLAAVKQVGGVVEFMNKLAFGLGTQVNNGEISGWVNFDTFQLAWEDSDLRRTLSEMFRRVVPKTHEWIPCENIDRVIERAAAGDFPKASRWLDVQNTLRSPTTSIIFKPTKDEAKKTAPDPAFDDAERVVLTGHPGVRLFFPDAKKGRYARQTKGEGFFHEDLVDVFDEATSLRGCVDGIRKTWQDWVWDGKPVDLHSEMAKDEAGTPWIASDLESVQGGAYSVMKGQFTRLLGEF
jgi:hypothetical protein